MFGTEARCCVSECGVQQQRWKYIHDFWDHVSTGDRITDVCTTFESESKQVIRKLYENNASMGEKFAVANFLLQIGALQFRVQKNPEDENELQTIIILQKPDDTQSKTEGHDETHDTVEESITKNDDDDDGDHVDVGDNNPSAEGVGEENNLAEWEKDSKSGENVEEGFVRPPPEEHECSICHSVLTSLWELDLHVLNGCSDETTGCGRPAKKQEEPDAKQQQEPEAGGSASDENDADWEPPVREKRKRGRPRKSVPSTISTPSTTTSTPITFSTAVEERQGSAKRKRGRPRKCEMSQEMQASIERKRDRPLKNDSSGKQESIKRGRGRPRKSDSLARKIADEGLITKEARPKIQLPKPQLQKLQLLQLQETRSKRKRRLPVKLREVFGEKKDDTPSVEPEQADGEKEDDTPLVDPEQADDDHTELDQTEEDQLMDDQVEEEVGMEGHNEHQASDLSEESETEDTNDDKNDDLINNDMTQRNKKEKSEKIYTCSTCRKSFSNRTSFRQHLFMHRDKATISEYECEVCHRVFYDKFEMKKHSKIHKEMYTCEFCDKEFSQISHYKRHRNNVHTKEVSFPCTLCDRVFYLKNRLKDHMVTHSGKKEFSCDMCKMKFFLLSQLKTHKKSVHVEGKPYLCDLCGSSFKSKGILKQHHLTVHTDIKKFPCRQCGKLFSRSSLRNQHERVHSGLNPYPCEHCGKGFRDKFKLKVHVNWHLGIHPFSCNVCQKTFLVKGNLTKHMRTHTGERPYVCEQCGRGCVDSSQLKKHMAQAHKIHIGRTLTKGPERADGELPSARRRKKKTDMPLIPYADGKSAEMQETQAYTIATDALIEISQQLADMSNTVQVPTQSADLPMDPKAGEGQNQIQQQAESSAASSIIQNGATAPEGSADTSIFPVMIQVNEQSNEVTVPVTQSIGDFQSLELITL